MKKIMIWGANSYIGNSLKKSIAENYANRFEVDEVDSKDENWRYKDYSSYDVVVLLAAIVHQKETKGNADLYYRINRDLASEMAIKSKKMELNKLYSLAQ